MKFHQWVQLDIRNRVCTTCNCHERVVYSASLSAPFTTIVREGDTQLCTLGNNLVRVWTNFRMKKD